MNVKKLHQITCNFFTGELRFDGESYSASTGSQTIWKDQDIVNVVCLLNYKREERQKRK